jgi:hypothetical protein
MIKIFMLTWPCELPPGWSVGSANLRQIYCLWKEARIGGGSPVHVIPFPSVCIFLGSAV